MSLKEKFQTQKGLDILVAAFDTMLKFGVSEQQVRVMQEWMSLTRYATINLQGDSHAVIQHIDVSTNDPGASPQASITVATDNIAYTHAIKAQGNGFRVYDSISPVSQYGLTIFSGEKGLLVGKGQKPLNVVGLVVGPEHNIRELVSLIPLDRSDYSQIIVGDELILTPKFTLHSANFGSTVERLIDAANNFQNRTAGANYRPILKYRA